MHKRTHQSGIGQTHLIIKGVVLGLKAVDEEEQVGKPVGSLIPGPLLGQQLQDEEGGGLHTSLLLLQGEAALGGLHCLLPVLEGQLDLHLVQQGGHRARVGGHSLVEEVQGVAEVVT